MRGRITAVILALAAPVAAQEDLPDFATCMDMEIARFERALQRHREGPEADSFEIGDVRGVEYCGTVGIVLCDRSDAPLPCQHALAGKQDALSDQVRATLPEPQTVAGQGEAPLYAALHAMAQDRSAGPDCEGDTPVMAAWCQAREANHRLKSAVSAWQLARYLDAAPDAITAGWARVPPPTRPKARTEKDKG
ncbi:hypothetical protein [Tropicibacter oceani]|uniref:Secreted protein n=1 Tax=Tropicibacter oceani TaxID=3058420 RepID=A0ABY8QFH0_9RHOB|nr:hypothetical protein [Tropicibacter oceani]WGW02547.1 hypothetical protein QF118_11385 [Tropicibacter oceani]